MSVELDLGLVTAFLLAMTRATAWLFITPPFGGNAIPQRVKLGLAVALAAFVTPNYQPQAAGLETWGFVVAVIGEAAMGLALGFAVYLLFSAVQAAGSLIDFSAGFTAGQIYDPMAGGMASPIARLYQLMATTILFAINGHLMLVNGFLASFETSPTGGPDMHGLGRILVHNTGTFFAAALQIALPMLAALFLAEIALGLLGKAAPSMNIMVVGFAAKMGLLFAVGAIALAVIPFGMHELLGDAVRSVTAIGGG